MNTKKEQQKETQKEKQIIINGKPINAGIYLDTLTPKANGNYTASIEVMEYLEIGHIIQSLISVCRSALENEQLPPNPLQISRTLEIVQNLIPMNELELLDELNLNDV